MKKILILLISLLTLSVSNILAAKEKFVVVIDPGHGGTDHGAIRGKHKEKTINLGVALELGKLIEQNNPDVKVVYTRKTDVFIALDKRAKIANKEKANLFISIHTNSTGAKNTTASGAETYILGVAQTKENLAVAKRENSVILLEDDYTTKYEGFDPKSPESYIIFEFMTNKYMDQSLEFASAVQTGFKDIGKRHNRGVKQTSLLVLRQSGMPSVLIELGFINNTTEATYLSSANGQKTLAKSIYAGFKKYKTKFDKMEGTVVVSQPTTTKIADTKPSKPSTNTSSPIEYRVQFYISPKKLAANASEFKGLKPVTHYKDGRMYKYTYGSTTSLKEITNIQNKIKSKFKDCFVVKFKDGKRVK